MVFSSIEFLFVFLPAFLALYFIDGRLANPVLLVFSLVFYFIGEGLFLLVMVASIAINTLVGRMIDRTGGRARRRWLAAGVTANLAILCYFKYLGFFAGEVAGFEGAWWAEGIHLPLGISFFTFQAISYLVDLSRGHCRAEHSVHRVGLYVAMFPQLIAGPIVRFASVAEDIRERLVTLRHLYMALGFFAIGLASKVMIADAVAPAADAVFEADPALLRADAAAAGILAYTLQIYFDFLGYSLMAVGLGFMLGFRFPRNFDHPYVSQSITEFWRRWHISLSSWFRDYVYIPLGGNRAGAARTYLNLWIVFLLTGLWHGAAWTFVFWGLFHGAFLVIERIGLRDALARMPAAARSAYVLAVVMTGWAFFRAETFAGATGILGALGRFDGPMPAAAYVTNEAWITMALGILFSGPWVAGAVGRIALLPRFDAWPDRLPTWPAIAGLLLFAALMAVSIVKILSGGYSPFIYFRF